MAAARSGVYAFAVLGRCFASDRVDRGSPPADRPVPPTPGALDLSGAELPQAVHMCDGPRDHNPTTACAQFGHWT